MAGAGLGMEDSIPFEIEHAAEEYLQYISDILNGVQDGREIREGAFREAQRWAAELTRLLKPLRVVPKNLMRGIFEAMERLENEADALPHMPRVGEIAQTVRVTLSLILNWQTWDEYVPPRPGVPRVR